MKRTVTFITTADTFQVFSFPPNEGEENPELWEAELTISYVDPRTGYSNRHGTKGSAYITRRTLELAGCLGTGKPKEEDPPVETVEDLIIRLLSCVGVFPTE